MDGLLTNYLNLMDDFLWPEEGPKQRSKRLRVLQAATEIFVRFGYQKASMDDIAQAARVSKGALYLYFPNKVNLLLSALAYEEQRYLQEHLRITSLHGTPKQKFCWVLEQRSNHRENSPLAAKFLSEPDDFLREIADASKEQETVAAIVSAKMRLLEVLIEEWLGDKFTEAEVSAISASVYDLIAGLMILPDHLGQAGQPNWQPIIAVIVGGIEGLKPGHVLQSQFSGQGIVGQPVKPPMGKSTEPQSAIRSGRLSGDRGVGSL
jgi:AcrR family transcriptional regulator